MATSTESRPVEHQRWRNVLVCGGNRTSAPTITSSNWRRIRMDIAGLEGVGCPSNLRSKRWGEGVVDATPRIPAGSQTVTGILRRDPACSCRKIQVVSTPKSTEEIYRRSGVRIVRGEGQMRRRFEGSRLKAYLQTFSCANKGMDYAGSPVIRPTIMNNLW